jgi:hypothetical protein
MKIPKYIYWHDGCEWVGVFECTKLSGSQYPSFKECKKCKAIKYTRVPDIKSVKLPRNWGKLR